MNDTTGYIYLAFKTEDAAIDLGHFSEVLSIAPTAFERMGARGHIPRCTSWIYSTGELINAVFHDEMEKLLRRLRPHKEEFRQLRKSYPQLEAVFEVVIYLGDDTPGLHFSTETLQFLAELSIPIDCDIYNSFA